MVTKSAKLAENPIALNDVTPALTFRSAVTPSMSSVPRFTLAAPSLNFTATDVADTVANPPAVMLTVLSEACRAFVPSSLISSARLPPDADAEKTVPSDRLTDTLLATTSRRYTAGTAGGPTTAGVTSVLRNAKSPPMVTKSAKFAEKPIALNDVTPALTFRSAVTPSMSSVP